MWRLLPFLFLLYIVAYLDRINVSFAILQMREQLHLSETVYGNAAGVFFLGYLLFQLPSNLGLHRVGVRRWICGLMVVWGMISCSMIFIRGPRSFYFFRFLLGAAEAGFFPGMIFYMRQWFPASARARAVAWFMTANAVAGIVGSPISGALLGVHGAGLQGWQWLFLLEGTPAIFLGAMVLWVLNDRPEEASWLSVEQKEWLAAELERERRENVHPRLTPGVSFKVGLRVLLLSAIYFAVPACMYGITFWLPTAMRSLSSLTYRQTGVLAIFPFLGAGITMVLVGMSSDRNDERRWHTALPALVAAAALIAAAYGSLPWVIISGMSLGLMAAQSMSGPFWALATSRMSGTAAAASIAVINSLANLGGYFGPYIIGLGRARLGGFRGGLLAIALTMILSGVLAILVGAQKQSKPAGFASAL